MDFTSNFEYMLQMHSYILFNLFPINSLIRSDFYYRAPSPELGSLLCAKKVLTRGHFLNILFTKKGYNSKIQAPKITSDPYYGWLGQQFIKTNIYGELTL